MTELLRPLHHYLSTGVIKDRMIETFRSNFKSFNINDFMCVHWLAY